MKLKTHLKSLLISSLLVTALCVTQASALEYGFDGADDYLFADPTSQDVIYQAEDQNVNRSKTAALIAPGFGTPTSYLRGSGEYLTPNLAPGAMSGGLVNAVGNYGYTDSSPGGYPATDTSISAGTYPPAGNENFTTSTIGQGSIIGYTDVTSDLYYSGGHLGTLKIPSIGVNVKIYQGTDSATLAKGAGHFTDTSIWAGNVCVAGHNRGTNCYFGEIHTLNIGDEITLTTMLGTRTYSVTSVQKISETDSSATGSTSDNRITLFTCVRNESAYRWCVTAVERA
ncbi:MAG: class D sortase [Dysosmobacter sp.]|nr:class D sortase [Dysosmobacter sp.]